MLLFKYSTLLNSHTQPSMKSCDWFCGIVGLPQAQKKILLFFLQPQLSYVCRKIQKNICQKFFFNRNRQQRLKIIQIWKTPKIQISNFAILRFFLRAKCWTAGGLALVAVGRHGKKSRNLKINFLSSKYGIRAVNFPENCRSREQEISGNSRKL